MINEMQAYLIHTRDPRFFDERLLGIPKPRLAEIRSAFVAGMPTCWLRDVTPDPAAVRPRSSAPRRRDGVREAGAGGRQGRVSINTASDRQAAAAAAQAVHCRLKLPQVNPGRFLGGGAAGQKTGAEEIVTTIMSVPNGGPTFHPMNPGRGRPSSIRVPCVVGAGGGSRRRGTRCDTMPSCCR